MVAFIDHLNMTTYVQQTVEKAHSPVSRDLQLGACSEDLQLLIA